MQKFASIEADIKEKLLAGLGSIGKEKRTELLQRQKELIEQKERVPCGEWVSGGYLEVKYKCPICKDHGIMDDGMRCSCVKERADEAYRWNKDRQIK